MIKKYLKEKPWGKYERFTENEKSTVKIITVKTGEKLSLQYHNHRDEFWKIMSGKGNVIIEEEIISINKGDEFFIPIGSKHSVESTEEDVIFLEIAFGDFDEEDIVRLEDKYGRIN